MGALTPVSLRLAPLLLVVIVTACLGCSSRPRFQLGGQCELATDCAADLVCRLGRCREECRTARDCRAGLICLREEGLGACQLPDVCALSSECDPEFVCVMGLCTIACREPVDCPPGSMCVENGCRDIAGTEECEHNTECTQPTYICTPDGMCNEQCHGDRDCRDGTRCDTASTPRICVRGMPDAGTTDADVDASESDGGDVDAGSIDSGSIDSGSIDSSMTMIDGGVITGPGPIPVLALGAQLSCAIHLGELRCWGDNFYGQLGDGTTMRRGVPTPVLTVSATATILGAGVHHTCASTASALYCWGDNLAGQVGDGTAATTRPSPTLIAGGAASSIAAGTAHTCAIRGGVVSCWGANAQGQLGDGTTTPHRAPLPTLALAASPVELTARGEQTCALLSNGLVQCWGSNMNGELGTGTASATPVTMPGLVIGLTDAIEIVAGDHHTCARRRDGSVLCWGTNLNGELGDGMGGTGGADTQRETPGLVPGLPPIVELAAGISHVCARAIDGRVLCWGDNTRGQVGVNNLVAMPRALVPVEVLGLGGAATELAAGDEHTCARLASGLRCWGANTRGQLGDGGTSESYMPVTVGWP